MINSENIIKLNPNLKKFVEGAKVRSKCAWYDEKQKSTKLFFNLEKKRALQVQI